MSKIIQPSDMFDLMGIKNREEAEKVLSETLDFLIYMRKGDILETSNAKFEKLSDDLFHVETNLESRNIYDSLENKKLIKFPV